MSKSKQQKQEEAIERNEAWADTSYKNQLAILKRRPGKSKKQIAKIKEKMND